MPRSNRPKRHGKPTSGAHDLNEVDVNRARSGWRRIETRRGVQWNVQPIAAERAQKEYVCPGCGQSVDIGVAHVVVWRADGVLGDESDLADRRHWHGHCWKIGP